ncbi:uncharacterized protein LOC110880889 [Helianthus annuus]|uniref:uncharacterized protein LOC110880889 n=1 Tax=Helianthus annuus TaxID=4232 RepID=UPI000B90872E|nr:uncharacterized protein LOC110880889 [Helianthus annuus]
MTASKADKLRKHWEFAAGERVMLKVSPWEGAVRFGKHDKLNSRYDWAIQILERIGKVAYKLELSDELGNTYDVFHITNLKKCLTGETLVVPLQQLKIDDKIQIVERTY